MGPLANASKSNLPREGPDIYSAITHPAAKLHITRKRSASFLFKLAADGLHLVGQTCENTKRPAATDTRERHRMTRRY